MDSHEQDWVVFCIFKDKASAELLAQQLESEGVPTSVQSSKLESAVETDWQVCVTKDLAHRARWILANSDFSEAELVYLATGELPKSDSSEKPSWVCETCGETIEGQFTDCWKCSGVKSE